MLCTGYLGEQVRNFFGVSYKSICLRYSQEKYPLGTAGALKLAVPLFQSDPIVVCNGDTLNNVSLESLLAYHVGVGAQATIAVVRHEEVGRYGQVVLNKNGQVLSFIEKGCGSGAGLVNAGIYLLNRSVLTDVPEGTFCSLENEIFPTLVKNGLFGIKTEGALWDIGTPTAFAVAQDHLIPVVNP